MIETVVTIVAAVLSFLGIAVMIRAPWKHRETGGCVCARCR